MITLWNHREAAITLDMGEQAEIRRLLSDHGIRYAVRVKNLAGSNYGAGRRRMGSFGQDLTQSYEYHIYVHRDDIETALALIHGADLRF
ncbi:MAG: hypothetical protein IKO91_05620 [Oscillospiraceae bacterium]|nr:hypothetical protein [Oscillospiraceae bacterium]